MAYNKSKLDKAFEYWSSDMVNFDFLKNSLGIVSPPNIVYNFLRKMFLMLHSINWPNFTVWLPLLLEILGSILFNWYSLHARLKSHYEGWRHKIKKHKKIKAYGKSVQKESTVQRCILILDLKPFRSKVKGKHS